MGTDTQKKMKTTIIDYVEAAPTNELMTATAT